MNKLVGFAAVVCLFSSFAVGCAAPDAPPEETRSTKHSFLPSKCLGNGICDESGNPEGPGPQDCQGDKCALSATQDQGPGPVASNDTPAASPPVDTSAERTASNVDVPNDPGGGFTGGTQVADNTGFGDPNGGVDPGFDPGGGACDDCGGDIGFASFRIRP